MSVVIFDHQSIRVSMIPCSLSEFDLGYTFTSFMQTCCHISNLIIVLFEHSSLLGVSQIVVTKKIMFMKDW